MSADTTTAQCGTPAVPDPATQPYLEDRTPWQNPRTREQQDRLIADWCRGAGRELGNPDWLTWGEFGQWRESRGIPWPVPGAGQPGSRPPSVMTVPGRPRSHAAPAALQPEKLSAVTQPDAAPEPPLRPSRWRTRFHHGRAADGQVPSPVRPGQEETWQEAPSRGRHARTDGTPGHPAADAREADTILPGQVPAFAAVTAEDDRAAAAVQQQSNAALMRAGAKPADLEHLARPGDGRDLPEQMAVPDVPQQGERQ
jgi:hypothetical protein